MDQKFKSLPPKRKFDFRDDNTSEQTNDSEDDTS